MHTQFHNDEDTQALSAQIGGLLEAPVKWGDTGEARNERGAPRREGGGVAKGLPAVAAAPGDPAESASCCGGAAPLRERVVTARGAWMQAASCGVISFLTLSRSMGKIFCTNASSCCLNSSAGYLASTCTTMSTTVLQSQAALTTKDVLSSSDILTAVSAQHAMTLRHVLDGLSANMAAQSST